MTAPLPKYLRFPFKNVVQKKRNDEASIMAKMDKETSKYKAALESGITPVRIKEIGDGIDYLQAWLKKEVQKNRF